MGKEEKRGFGGLMARFLKTGFLFWHKGAGKLCTTSKCWEQGRWDNAFTPTLIRDRKKKKEKEKREKEKGKEGK